MKSIYVFGTRGFPGVQGGVEKHCEYLYGELQDQYVITVFRRKAFLTSESSKQIENINFVDLPSTRIKGFESFFHSLLCSFYCIIKRPAIVHIHNIGPGMFIPLLRVFKLKVVLTYHSANYEHDKWGWLSKRILKLSEWLAVNFASKVIFVNEKQLKRFNQGIQRKSLCIPNGVYLKPILRQTDYIEQLGLKSRKYILSVGRITQEKGFDYLLDAFLLAHVDVKLVLVGGVDHPTHYSRLVHQKAHQAQVVMAGYVDGENLQQLYSHACLFVLPSYNEGFPLVLLEAMSYQLPILASNILANKQLPLGENDFFEVGNVLDLMSKIQQKLAVDFRLQQFQLQDYTWKNVADQVDKVYLSLY